MQLAAVIVPSSAYVALSIAGFFFAEPSWTILVGSIIAWTVFKVRPDPILLLDAGVDPLRVFGHCGADPNARAEGSGPLHVAAASGDAEEVSVLLDAGADPNARAELGSTPLHAAAYGGNAAAVAALLAAGADPNARSEGGWTPLQIAADRGHAEVVSVFLDADVESTASTDEVKTPFDDASQPDLTFMAAIPDSESSRPTEFEFRDFVILYHENPKTIGEKFGIPSMFAYPQLAVVKAPGAADPQLIVRVETSGIGDPMLCTLDPSGMRRNFGAWSSTDQNSFVRKAADIAMQMANGSGRAS